MSERYNKEGKTNARFIVEAVDAHALLIAMERIKEYSHGNGIEDVALDAEEMTFQFTVSRYAMDESGGHSGWDRYTASFTLHPLHAVSGAMGITPNMHLSRYFILVDEHFEIALDLANTSEESDFHAWDFAWQECDHYLREALGNLPQGQFVMDELGRRWVVWFEGEVVETYWIEKAEGVVE